MAAKASCASEPAVEISGEPIGYCVDAGTDVRRYGSGANVPLDGACTEFFGDECELYRRFELASITTFSLVEKKNPKNRISVTKSRFDSALGAYGFFQRRVVATDDPAQISLANLTRNGVAVLRGNALFLWRGSSIFELVYSCEDEPADVVERLARVPLESLARALDDAKSERSPANSYLSILEGSAKFRPVFLGTRVHEGEVFGRAHVSRFVETSVEFSEKRFRVLLVEARDRTAAKELLVQITRANLGEKWEPTKTLDFRFAREGLDPENYVLGIENAYLFGISRGGDDEIPRSMVSELASLVREAIRNRGSAF